VGNALIHTDVPRLYFHRAGEFDPAPPGQRSLKLFVLDLTGFEQAAEPDAYEPSCTEGGGIDLRYSDIVMLTVERRRCR
jgi:hypothetical protein